MLLLVIAVLAIAAALVAYARTPKEKRTSLAGGVSDGIQDAATNITVGVFAAAVIIATGIMIVMAVVMFTSAPR